TRASEALYEPRLHARAFRDALRRRVRRSGRPREAAPCAVLSWLLLSAPGWHGLDQRAVPAFPETEDADSRRRERSDRAAGQRALPRISHPRGAPRDRARRSPFPRLAGEGSASSHSGLSG